MCTCGVRVYIIACVSVCLLLYVFTVWLVIAVLLPTALELDVVVKPAQRGFYCDDESLSKPYNASIVSILVVTCVGFLLNIFTVSFG